jgi:aryl-alcohol dehydrogenase-like predicted oxidoreductase
VGRPYGDWGSRKYLLSSLDQSLMRMNVDYVDVFYSHRFDPETFGRDYDGTRLCCPAEKHCMQEFLV